MAKAGELSGHNTHLGRIAETERATSRISG
jgi:hypothetical protein